MSARKIRRIAAHAARKAARKAGLPNPQPRPPATPIVPIAEAVAPPPSPEPLTFPPDFADTLPEPGQPFPSLSEISPARMAANKANAKLSKGALSPETRAISAQNHATHGLARHQAANFKILTCENAASFDGLKEALIAEHQPATETESILVNRLAQSHWLENRAQCLQELCTDPDTGAVTDEKKFSLYMRYKTTYMRYKTTHTRSFHKCLNDLLKLRREKHKAELGVEAQRVQSEKHELKKQHYYWDILKADASACREMGRLADENTEAWKRNPDFPAQYNAELAKRGLEKNFWEVASKAA